MGTTTTNYALYKPDSGETGWAASVNAAIDTIDDKIFTHNHSGGTNSQGSITPTTLQTLGQVRFNSILAPAQITADQNNYNPTGFSTAAIVQLTTDADRTITGLGGFNAGQLKVLVNANASGGGAVILAHQSTSSTAGNRMVLPNETDLTLGPGESAMFLYGMVSSRWTYVGTVPASTGGGGGAVGAGATVVKSGATYEAYAPDGSLLSSGSDAGAVINACFTANYHALLRSKTLYNCTTKVSVPQNLSLVGPEGQVADLGTGCVIEATGTISGGLVELAGSDSSIRGVNVDANGNADYAVSMIGVQTSVSFCSVGGGKLVSLYVNGPGGAQRCNVSNTRVDNASASPSYTVSSVDTAGNTLTLGSHKLLVDDWVTISSTGTLPSPLVAGTRYWVVAKTATTITLGNSPGAAAIDLTTAGSGTITVLKKCNASLWVQGPDHIVSHLRITGAPNDGYAMVLAGQHTQVTGGHVTAQELATGNTYFANTGNTVTGILWDTGPNGTNGNDVVTIAAGYNSITGCHAMNSKSVNSDLFVLRKEGSGDFIQGVVIAGSIFDGDGPTGPRFRYGVAIYDENGSTVTNLARFGGLKVTDCTFKSIRKLTNVALDTASNADAVFIQNCDRPQSSTSDPQYWRTDARGKATFSGDGVTTAFSIPHGLSDLATDPDASGDTYAVIPRYVSITPFSSAARIAFSVAVDKTNITVTFASAPASAANNVVLGWEARI